MHHLQLVPYMLENEAGPKLAALGALIMIKATSEQTGGAFNLFEIFCPPAFATSLQIHYAEDVVVYVLEGELSFFWGYERKAAVAGSYFYQPRGISHGFRVEGDRPAKILYLAFPGGLDRFVIEEGQFAPDCETVTAAARYKIEILGPLPE